MDAGRQDNRLGSYTDLAPHITRQRLVVEGFPKSQISDEDIRRYLTTLSEVLDMKALITPVTNRSREYGWAGWIHWETSGAHFYAWNQHHPQLFFSVDIYACKAFDPKKAVQFTQDFFEATEITYKEF